MDSRLSGSNALVFLKVGYGFMTEEKTTDKHLRIKGGRTAIGAVLSVAICLCNYDALALVAKPWSAIGTIYMQDHRDAGKVELVVDTSGASQSSAIKERFDRGLDELNRTMPNRMTSPIELNVTEKFRPYLPEHIKIEDYINDFEKLGLRAQRDKSGSHTYFTYFTVPYDRLAADGRKYFLGGDKLVITYMTSGPDGDAEITKLSVVLLNDRFL